MKKFEQLGELGLPMHHPHYRQMHAIEVFELKKVVYFYCSGMEKEEKPKFDENAIIPELLPVWLAFKKSGFNFYKFMYSVGPSTSIIYSTSSQLNYLNFILILS